MRIFLVYPSPTPTPHALLPPLEEAMAGDLDALRTRFLPLFSIDLSAVDPAWSGKWYALHHEHIDGRLDFRREPGGRLTLIETVGWKDKRPLAEMPLRSVERIDEIEDDPEDIAASFRREVGHDWLELVPADLDLPPYSDPNDDYEGHAAWKDAWYAAVDAAAQRARAREPLLVLLGEARSVQVDIPSWAGAFLTQHSVLGGWDYFWGFSPDHVTVNTDTT